MGTSRGGVPAVYWGSLVCARAGKEGFFPARESPSARGALPGGKEKPEAFCEKVVEEAPGFVGLL